MDPPSSNTLVPCSRVEQLAVGSKIVILPDSNRTARLFYDLWSIYESSLRFSSHRYSRPKNLTPHPYVMLSNLLFVPAFLIQIDFVLHPLVGVSITAFLEPILVVDAAPLAWNLGLFLPVSITWELFLRQAHRLKLSDENRSFRRITHYE